MATTCKSKFVTKFVTYWGAPKRAWLTTYTDTATGREVSFWGRVMKTKTAILAGVPVTLTPTN